MAIERAPSLLEGVKVLDLAEQETMLCGKILADLGADVIKIERPCGSASRIGPYYKDSEDPEQSLPWIAYNLNKRSITLNLEARDGQELFRKLVDKADFVLESSPVGYLDELSLGYDSLAKINPRIIVTSITPFGQTGPYSAYAGSEIVCMALSGFLYVLGDPDRPPVWISYPQANQHAGAEAAVGTLIAHYYREETGEGQQVDVSIQDSAVTLALDAPQFWDVNKVLVRRVGPCWMLPNAQPQMIYPCKDGYIICHLLAGGELAMLSSTEALRAWLHEEGMAPEWLLTFDLANDYDAMKWTPELMARVQEPFAKFFLGKTKRELLEEAVKRRIILGVVATAEDIIKNPHLAARDFFAEIKHPGIDKTIKYPTLGVMVNNSRFAGKRVPLVGEHNKEVYQDEFGLNDEQLAALKSAGVI